MAIVENPIVCTSAPSIEVFSYRVRRRSADQIEILSIVAVDVDGHPVGSRSQRRQTKTAKVRTATCLNGDKRHVHNGDKLKRRNPKRQQEMVGLCEAFIFQAEDGIRDFCLSRGLGDVYKRQGQKVRRLSKRAIGVGMHASR